MFYFYMKSFAKTSFNSYGIFLLFSTVYFSITVIAVENDQYEVIEISVGSLFDLFSDAYVRRSGTAFSNLLPISNTDSIGVRGC